MSTESKCNCQHCNGHISFPSEMAGQTIACPHCQLETLLFIPPDTTSFKSPQQPKKNTNTIGFLIAPIVILLVLIAVFVARNSQNQKQSIPSNLKPVVGALGYKLGDKLTGAIEDYAPLNDTPPFTSLHVDTTTDGRICIIEAMGHTDEYDAYDSKKRLVSVLSEKYGLRFQYPKSGADGKDEEYDFGTVDQTAHLKILHGNYFYLDYYDQKLRSIYFDEQRAKTEKEDADKKAALSKDL